MVKGVLTTDAPVECEVTSRDGTIYLMRVLPYRGAGTKSGVVLTLIDIGARKRSEARTRQYAAIVESSQDAILAKDLRGVIFGWNRGATQLYGFTAEEAIGKHVSFLVPEDRRDEVRDMLARVADGQTIEPFETVRLRKDGTPVDVAMTVSPIYDEHDSLVGASTSARDITQRRRDERTVRRALSVRDQFLAMISHEMRNPLAALVHACAILNHQAVTDGSRKHALEVVERQCRHMARLLDDLLDVSRLRQDGVELRKESIDLRSTIESALERVRPMADAKGITLDVNVPEEQLPVLADTDRIQQVEANLLNNAVKYSPRDTSIRLELTRSGESSVVLRVSDEGHGVPPDMIDRIFEPFVRVADDAEHRNNTSNGMGLGLALVRSIVLAHGGSVKASNNDGAKGSTFTVELPLAFDGHAGVELGKGRHSDPRSIVLVEDQDDSRELLKELLEYAGYEVHVAGDGSGAIALLERVRPGAALIDIGLPDMSGHDIARHVRTKLPAANVFLVALTGYGQQQDRDKVVEAGFDQHLVKPIDAQTLLDVLRTRAPIRNYARV